MENKILNIIKNIKDVLFIKEEIIKLIISAMLADGHVLIDDIPGIGKTTLVKSLAASLTMEFKRIQFTPDIMPSDINGVSVYSMQSGKFEFHKGPIFANIIIADELNRGTPNTQSALLECMEERQTTIDGITYKLSKPFFVVATQNPFEYEGTFPLIESQKDRFMLSINIGYPALSEEINLYKKHLISNALDQIKPCINIEEFIFIQKKVQDIHISDSVFKYIVMLVNQTRSLADIELGLSPRCGLYLCRLSQAWAYINQKEFVTPDDIKILFPYICKNKMKIKFKRLFNETEISQESLQINDAAQFNSGSANNDKSVYSEEEIFMQTRIKRKTSIEIEEEIIIKDILNSVPIDISL